MEQDKLIVKHLIAYTLLNAENNMLMKQQEKLYQEFEDTEEISEIHSVKHPATISNYQDAV